MIGWLRRRVWPWIWLGLRLTGGAGRRVALRTLLLGGVCAVAVFFVLAAMAIPVVSDAQRERSYSRTPVFDEGLTVGLKMAVIHDAIDRRPLLRIAIADATVDSVLPPGLPVFPAPGEIVVSPELLRLMSTNPSARHRFPQRVIGQVSPSGLVAPDELLAYTGVTAASIDAGSGVVTGFRSDDARTSLGSSELERLLTPPRVVSASFALFLVLPLSVLLAICVRFDSARRDRRLAALRLIGVSSRQVHLSAAVEMTFIAATGVAAGLALFSLISGVSEGWHVGRFYWYASDVRISPARIAVLALLVVGLAVLVSAAGSRPAIRFPLQIRRSGRPHGPSYGRLAPLVIAPLALLAATSTLLTTFQRLIALGIGVVAAALTLVMVTPLVLSGAGALVAKVRVLPVWALLAARRATHTPAVAPRLVTSVLVAIYVAGLGMLIGTSVREEALGPLSADRPHETVAVAEAFGVSQSVVEELRTSPAVAGVGVMRRVVATGQASAGHAVIVWTSCQDLTQLFDRVGDCADGQRYQLSHTGENSRTARQKPGDEVRITSGTHKGEALLVPQQKLEVAGNDYGCQCDIVITSAPGSGDIVVRLAATAEEFWGEAARLAPGTRFQGSLERERGFDSDAVLTLIYVGLTLTVLLSFLGFIVASIDRGVQARHKDAPLLAIGVPGWVLRLAEAAQLLVVVVSGTLLAVALLMLTSQSWARTFEMPLGKVMEPLLPLFGGVLGAMILMMLAVIALTTRNRKLSAADLRRE